ncbi:MAG: hypothetical protein PVJ49_01495 [Acidobacteriota bacterium]|jgi:hypothetical protein
MRKTTGWTATLLASMAMAAASTLADLVWALWIPAHRAVYGLIHGALLFMLLGLVLGALAAPVRTDLPRGALALRGGTSELFAGLAGAATFYALFGLIGWAAMFVAWMWLWMLTAFINRWLRGALETPGFTLARGVGAALLSGVAFWAISGIWLGGSTRNPDYVVNFASWLVAFAPGFACLLLRPVELSAGATTSS